MKINESNFTRIDTIIKEAEGHARCRTATASEILDRVNHITREFDIAPVHLKGTKIHVNVAGGQHFPSSYRGNPEATWFEAIHNGHGWNLVRVWRDSARKSGYIWLSEETKIWLVKKVAQERSALVWCESPCAG